jgi:hypothetical protein
MKRKIKCLHISYEYYKTDKDYQYMRCTGCGKIERYSLLKQIKNKLDEIVEILSNNNKK